jgi:transposase-like protein
VRERVERLLDSDSKKRVYEALAGGTTAVSAVEKATGVNHNDINKWVAEWQAERIVEPDAKPPKAMFTLQELGISPAPPRTPRRRPASD